MKKLIIATAIIAGFGTFAAHQAMAADGTIALNGEISAVTCSVHGGTPGNNSGDFTVPLRNASTSEFKNVGDVAAAGNYSIFVGEASEAGCTDGTVVHVHYEPNSPQIDQTTGNLKVTGGADGVQIQLLNNDRSVINLANASDSATYTISGNTTELPFFAQYVSTATSITPGIANSSVLYSIAYD
jgi:major type 1 subunit fimbrin (pilin)